MLAFVSAVLAPQGPALTLPDAQLAAIDVEGAGFRAGDRVALTIRVRNSGDVPLPPVPVTLSVKKQPYAEWKLPAELQPEETAAWSLVWHATRGAHLLTATIDPLNEVVESSEANNSAFINLGVAEARDPFPWGAIAAGLGAFFAGAAAAVFLRRLLPSGALRRKR